MEQSQNERKGKILIVDDNVTNLQVLGSILREKDYDILIAKDGPTAINTTIQHLPDIILLDIMMPQMDGYEVCNRIRGDKLTATIPIIFISAKNDEDAIVKGFDVGGQDYISKPFINKELLARVNNQLSIRKNEKQLEEIIRAKNSFFSQMTQTLKDPLAQLASFSQMLPSQLEAEDYRKASEYAHLISSTALDQFKVFENLIEWSKIQTGHYDPFLEDVDVNSAIQRSIDLLHPVITAKKLEVSVEINAGIVFGDPEILDTVLRNLLGNACKFSHEGGKIQVSTEEKGEHVELRIRDYGEGLTEEEANMILLPGTDLSSINTDSEEKGACLGLKISNELVKILEGKLFAKGYAHEGAEFIAELQAGL